MIFHILGPLKPSPPWPAVFGQLLVLELTITSIWADGAVFRILGALKPWVSWPGPRDTQDLITNLVQVFIFGV